MKNRSLVFGVVSGLLALILSVPAQAQVSKLMGQDQFSGESVLLKFDEQPDGAPARDLYSQWGLTFLGNDAIQPEVTERLNALAMQFNVILNGNSSPDVPLIIDFHFPVQKVGFRLGNGASGVTATLTAFDSQGKNLGSVQQSLESDTFVGISTSSSLGISKLLVDYGSSANSEQLNNIIFDYVSRPRFISYLAQIASGPVPGGKSLQTVIVISNMTNSTAQGDLRLFADDGSPLNVDLDGTTDSTFSLSVPAFGTRTFTTTETGSLAVGYACIDASTPVQGTAVFRIFDSSGQLNAEAGVSADTPKIRVLGPAQHFLTGDFNTGFAVVNGSDEATTVRVDLFQGTGGPLTTPPNGQPFNIDLEPHGHAAMFLTEMFHTLADEDFTGTIVISSPKPITVVLLRSSGGLVRSSLQTGSTQK